jgi:hypothetical protein
MSGIILNNEMLVVGAGNHLIESWSVSNENRHPNLLIGSHFSEYFYLRRPTDFALTFENVKSVSLHRSMNATN